MSILPCDPLDKGECPEHLEGSLTSLSAHFRGKRLLFINPPVVCASNIQVGWYSYAHPTSLLKLARHQQDLGHHVTLIDCMDYVEKARPRMAFYKKLPLGAAALKLERSAYILGRGFDWLRTQLQNAAEPDEIWVSCHITFNAELAHRAIRLARERFPNAPVVFGGNYPTLFPDDAGRTGATPHVGPVSGAERYYPDYSLFDRRVDYVVFQLTLGCMNSCAHCLNHRLPRKVVRLDPGEVASHIGRSRSEHGVRTFVNIDPNTAAFGLEAFLEQVVSRELDIDLYFYGGIQPDLVTSSLVRLMQRARVKGFTLPAELGPTANAALNKSYSEGDFRQAVRLFQEADFDLSGVHCTFPVGLKHDRRTEIVARVREIISLGMIVEIAPVALAPGTPEYDRHLYALAGKSLEELNWALWPTLDTQDKISWFARLTGDKLEGYSERAP